MRFSSKFDKNRREKRAAIKASSIFPESSSSASGNKRLELESKRRRIKASSASALLTGRVKPSSWQLGQRSLSGQNGISVASIRSK